MSERDLHPRYEFVWLDRSLEEFAEVAQQRGIKFEICEFPNVGVRQLWFDEREVGEISRLNAAICAFRQPDGSERVRTLSGFIPILSRLLGQECLNDGS